MLMEAQVVSFRCYPENETHFVNQNKLPGVKPCPRIYTNDTQK